MIKTIGRLAALGVLTAVSPANAAPTATELVEVCQSAIDSNFSGVPGKMCTWYVTPCDCDTAPGVPRVCLTDPVEPDKLAFTFIEMMKVMPELTDKGAEEAVGIILSEIYPCDG